MYRAVERVSYFHVIQGGPFMKKGAYAYRSIT
jgi:hypothetical protein